MRSTSVVLALSLLALTSACAMDDHGLGAAHQRWTGQKLQGYSVTTRTLCFCPTEMTDAIRLTVAAGQITDAVYVDSQQAVAPVYRQNLLTIDGLFDKIQNALDRNAEQLDVTYDPVMGYPTSIAIDYRKQTSDDEISYTVKDLVPAS